MERKGLLSAGLLLGTALSLGSSWAFADDPAQKPEKSRRPAADRRVDPDRVEKFLDRLFDGKDTVDRERFEEALKRVRQARLKAKKGDGDRREPSAEKLFDRLDANGDGKLTRDEASKLPTRDRDRDRGPERKKQADPRDGGRLFEEIAGGKDRIGRDQWESFLKRRMPRIEERHPKAAERLFNQLDDDKDGKINRDESKKIPDALERLRKAAAKGDR